MTNRAPSGHRAGRATPPSRPDSVRVTDTSALVRRDWSAGEIPFGLRLRPPGVVLGVDRQDRPFAVPLLGPAPSRVGIVGNLDTARLVATRLAEVGCEGTVVTRRPEAWLALRAASTGAPMTITDHIARWPAESSLPPRALVVDMPQPPPAGLGRVPWSTVVHLVDAVPAAPWWQSAHVLLVDAGFAGGLSGWRTSYDVTPLQNMAAGEVGVISGGAVRVFRPRLTGAERAWLS